LDVYFPLDTKPIDTESIIDILKIGDGISAGDVWKFYRERTPGELPKRVPVWFVNALWALAQDGMIVYRGDRVYSRGADL
jgi:hypothetical protein